MRNLPVQALSDVNTAGAKNGVPIDANQLINMSFQALFSDVAAAGTLKLQGSNDSKGTAFDGDFTPTNWSDIPSQTATAVSGVAPMIVVSNLSCQWIRVVWTRSAGAGTVIVNMSAAGA